MSPKYVFGTILGGVLGLSIAAGAQELLRLREILVTTPVMLSENGEEVNPKYKVHYLLDNSTCFLILEDKDGKFLGITDANKASCNKVK